MRDIDLIIHIYIEYLDPHRTSEEWTFRGEPAELGPPNIVRDVYLVLRDGITQRSDIRHGHLSITLN